MSSSSASMMLPSCVVNPSGGIARHGEAKSFRDRWGGASMGDVLKGRDVLLTGVTGFVGGVLLAKMLKV